MGSSSSIKNKDRAAAAALTNSMQAIAAKEQQQQKQQMDFNSSSKQQQWRCSLRLAAAPGCAALLDTEPVLHRLPPGPLTSHCCWQHHVNH